MGDKKKVAELLKQLQKEGAVIKKTDPTGKPGGQILLEEEIQNLAGFPDAFNAWVSWTKSF